MASPPGSSELAFRRNATSSVSSRRQCHILQVTPDKTVDLTKVKDPVDIKPLYRLPKTDMPAFEGDPKLWRRFWERFSQRLSMYPDLPASEKIAQLEQAIKPLEGKALISAPKGTQTIRRSCSQPATEVRSTTKNL